MKRTLQESVQMARKYAHGSYLHGEAMNELYAHYRAAHQGCDPIIHADVSIPGETGLAVLWRWIASITEGK